MNNYIVIACENFKDEIEYVAKDLNINPEIVWVESKLHVHPQKLNEKLQEIIDEYNGKNILLFFGCCGTAAVNISSTKNKIICPRVDDCVSCFLGGNENRNSLEDSCKTFFFTSSCADSTDNIFSQMLEGNKEYTEEEMDMIYEMMFKNYKYAKIIDTKCYDINLILGKTKDFADKWNLKHDIVNGDLSIFYKALKGEWDEDFILLNEGEKNKLENYM